MKYLAVFAVAARQAWRARGETAGRAVFYALLILVFAQLWRAMGGRGGFTAAEFVWYLALTELVALGPPLVHSWIEDDVRRGDIAYHAARPASYLGVKIAEACGDTFARLGYLLLAGLVTVWLFIGALPADPRGLLLALPLVAMACVLSIVLQAGIGLTALWLQEATPAYWIWQKLLFVFGGLFFPLDIYPDWLRTIALWTPFAPMMYGPARCALVFDPWGALATAGQLVLWGAASVFVLSRLYRHALRRMDVNGG